MLRKKFESARKEDFQLIEGCSPFFDGHGPFSFEALDGYVHEFEHRIIIGKNSSGFNGLSQTSVDRFNRMAGIIESSEFGHKTEPGNDFRPVVAPGLCQSGVSALPLLVNDLQSSECFAFGVCGIDGFEIPRDLFTVFIGDEFQRIAQEVDNTGLVLALREC
jgi:hypothetical protein